MKLTIPEASYRGISPPTAIGVILTEGAKTKIFYFASPGTAVNGSSDLSKGEVDRKPEAEPSGNYLD